MSNELADPLALLVTRMGITEKSQPTPVTPRPLSPWAAAQPDTKVPCPLMSPTSPPSTCARRLRELKPGTSASCRSG
jgi:hypothetical protein